MYSRDVFKGVRHIIPETVACVGTTTNYNSSSLNSSSVCIIPGYSTQILGQNFMCTIECTTGAIYVRPESTAVPVATDSFKISEGGILDIKVKNLAAISGNSTTAKFQALIWSDV